MQSISSVVPPPPLEEPEIVSPLSSLSSEIEFYIKEYEDSFDSPDTEKLTNYAKKLLELYDHSSEAFTIYTLLNTFVEELPENVLAISEHKFFLSPELHITAFEHEWHSLLASHATFPFSQIVSLFGTVFRALKSDPNQLQPLHSYLITFLDECRTNRREKPQFLIITHTYLSLQKQILSYNTRRELPTVEFLNELLEEFAPPHTNYFFASSCIQRFEELYDLLKCPLPLKLQAFPTTTKKHHTPWERINSIGTLFDELSRPFLVINKENPRDKTIRESPEDQEERLNKRLLNRIVEELTLVEEEINALDNQIGDLACSIKETAKQILSMQKTIENLARTLPSNPSYLEELNRNHSLYGTFIKEQEENLKAIQNTRDSIQLHLQRILLKKIRTLQLALSDAPWPTDRTVIHEMITLELASLPYDEIGKEPPSSWIRREGSNRQKLVYIISILYPCPT